MGSQLTFTEQMLQTSEDITSNKHRGNDQSKEANKKVNKLADRQKIVDYLKEYKVGTSKDFARYLGKQLNQISGRLTELRLDNIIEPNECFGNTVVKEGCLEYRLTKEN